MKPTKVSLPQVITEYFASVNEARIVDAAACFASDARVHDENHDFEGVEAIREWIEDTTLKYRATTELTHVEAKGEVFAATATVTGNFPGSPISLTFTFTLREEKIAHLDIQ